MLKNYFGGGLGTSLFGGVLHILALFISYRYVAYTLVLIGFTCILYIIGFICFVILLYKLAKYVDQKAKKST